MLSRSAAVTLVLALAAPGVCRASILWSETNGDLSNIQNSPRYLYPIEGSNSIVGTVGGTDTKDWFTLSIPEEYQLTSIILVSYISNDPQAFLGFQVGPVFLGNLFAPGSYAGYAHVGTGALNGSNPPTDLTGSDLLALMADPAVAGGATGFTRPLDTGDYAFLFQQLSTATSYELNFIVAPVPGPAPVGIGAIAALSALGRRRRPNPPSSHWHH